MRVNNNMYLKYMFKRNETQMPNVLGICVTVL